MERFERRAEEVFGLRESFYIPLDKKASQDIRNI
jgi:hypothetical protein